MGCGVGTGELDPDAVDPGAMSLAAEDCGDRWGAAFTHYKQAVDASKERLRSGVCESEIGLLWSIADSASRAVMTCGDFRRIIRTSPWAEPLRRVLAPSLTLRSFTGELLVIKDSVWQNWTGTEAFFDAGLTFWARAQGAYGSAAQVDFMADGVARWGEHTYDEASGEIGWRTVPATYRVEASGETDASPRRVVVTREGEDVTFSLGVRDPEAWKDAPLFLLQPLDTTTGAAGAPAVPDLFSLVSECDA